jgi:hypothetical protein
VLADELRGDAPSTHRIFRGHDDDAGPANRYRESALQSMHASLTDFLPLRRFSLLVWFLTGLIPMVGLVALNDQQSVWSKMLGKSYLHSFDFTASGNLANWLSSIVLASAAVVMWGIYSVRKHRRDDYRARFMVWRWAIAAAVFLSMDATAGLHNAWQGCCQYLFETPLSGDGSIWWVGTWSLVFGILLARLMLEMRRSWLSIAGAIVAGCSYFTSALIHLDLAPQLADRFGQTVQTITVLFGHHCVLFTVVSYARHVVLEAMGKIDAPAKLNRQRNAKTRTDDEHEQVPKLRMVTCSDDETHKVSQPPKPASRPLSQPTGRPKLVVHAHESHESNEELDDTAVDTVHRRLSKAERKRLRKEKRRRAA